jgi:hypothetical protein
MVMYRYFLEELRKLTNNLSKYIRCSDRDSNRPLLRSITTKVTARAGRAATSERAGHGAQTLDHCEEGICAPAWSQAHTSVLSSSQTLSLHLLSCPEIQQMQL